MTPAFAFALGALFGFAAAGTALKVLLLRANEVLADARVAFAQATYELREAGELHEKTRKLLEGDEP